MTLWILILLENAPYGYWKLKCSRVPTRAACLHLGMAMIGAVEKRCDDFELGHGEQRVTSSQRNDAMDGGPFGRSETSTRGIELKHSEKPQDQKKRTWLSMSCMSNVARQSPQPRKRSHPVCFWKM